MSSPVITAENLGKKYRLNHRAQTQRYTTLREVIADKAKRLIGAGSRISENSVPETEDFWALEDVSFDIKEGEVVGFIGRNGAGKSTLLKILSRITEPTTGRVRIRGRVASLLEVGTGFHPELTGRENIYLNGAILGMSRADIKRKFDEIVAFSGVEQFLDTPVKRYSSGMYVRLAFAVAAHLEPDILVVDEVLAVGDAEFQKKCLGKLHDVSKGGRTVLFVSHNIAAIKSLTSRALVLNAGRVILDSATELAVQAYVNLSALGQKSSDGRTWGRGKHTAVHSVRLLDAGGGPTARYAPGEPLRLEVEFETDGTAGMSLEIFLADASRLRIGMASLGQFQGQALPDRKGAYVCEMCMLPMWLASGNYSLDVSTSVINVNWDHQVESALEFEVPFSNPVGGSFDFKQSYGFGHLALISSSSRVVQREVHYRHLPELANTRVAPARDVRNGPPSRTLQI